MTDTTITDAAIEEHPLVVAANASLAAAERELAERQAGVVRGLPLNADDLGRARSKIEYEGLLVERARNEARTDLRRQRTAQVRAAELRAEVEALDGDPLGGLEALRTEAVDALVRLCVNAAAHETRVKAHARAAADIPDHQGLGLFVDNEGSPTMVRTQEVTLVSATPQAVFASVVADALAAADIVDPTMLSATTAGVRAWSAALEHVAVGPHRGPLLDEAGRAEAYLARTEARRRRSHDQTLQAQYEAEERARKELRQPPRTRAEWDAERAAKSNVVQRATVR